jgi:proteic killer suppression protein
MNIEFRNPQLEQLETDPSFTNGRSAEIVRAYRKLMNLIRTAESSKDLREFKSRHFERLKGKRKHQRSLKINNQYRLVVEMENSEGKEVMAVIAIEDYHK